MFEDLEHYPFTADLERNWQIIRDEMIALRSTGFIAWPEKSLYGEAGRSTAFCFSSVAAVSGRNIRV